jgi:hypothetical protein
MVRATVALLAVLVGPVVTAEQAVNPPPQPLHLVGDHWTPYDPPTEFPPDANVYIIQPGDTLWDLAAKSLGNPYLWPQIWEQNQYIRDAHWIYPGDPLVIGVKAAEVPATPEPATEAAPAEGERAAVAGAGEAPPTEALELVPVGSEDDIYCFGYLGPVDEEPQMTVTSAEQLEYQASFFTGDIVYLSHGTAEGVEAGQEYFLIDPAREVRHPATGAVLGRMMRYVGYVRVLCAQEHTATAEVMSSCDEVLVGNWLKPFEAIPIPMAALTEPATRCDLPNDKPKGYIVYAKDDIVAFGQDHVVLLDLGASDDLTPGTVCTIYRDNRVAGAPRIVLGEAAVLTTGDHWASAKIMTSSLPLGVGDRVEVK